MSHPRGLASTIGTAARAARVRANLTQEDVAERVGLATEVYGRLERGGMLPSVPTLKKLCEVLHIPSDILLGLTPAQENFWTQTQETPAQPVEEPAEIRRLLRNLRKLEPAELRLLSIMAAGLLRLRPLRHGRSPHDAP
ncbi:helix-turn-helix transcriptional regulator [Archangium violaceum]|uniref:helix-turn-helix transcriptional regulator n=1 Tax=Archangium violaceum TaxID=83451 RepID=UPI00193C0587|nr:helix-turn-helix transcriptional regulator [Archangium violaceum]QRK07196.1 helix-turn-helix transcriptional regulator [Archangium violaceum]